MKLLKMLSSKDIRLMCNTYEYYTLGDSCSYMNMLQKIPLPDKDITMDEVKSIAEDIKNHSDTEDSVMEIMQKIAFRIRCLVVVEFSEDNN